MPELTEQERSDLAQLVMGIFEEWRLDPEEQLLLLGYAADESQQRLTRFRHGTPLPQEGVMLERARHILGIQEALKVVFPRTARQGAFWLRNYNAQFRMAPLAVMLDQGLEGLGWVWGYLDCTQTWR